MTPTYGTMTPSVLTYSNGNCIQHNQACLFNLAPCERIQLCVEMDKASYNDAVFANNTTGDFDTNFKNIALYNPSSEPIGEDPHTTTSLPFSFVTIIDETDFTYKFCVEFRIPEDWQGKTNYINFVWSFMHGNPMDTEYISYPFTLVVAEPISTGVTLFDQDKNALNSLRCGNELTAIDICFDTTNYEFTEAIWFHLAGSEINENNAASDCFNQLQSDKFLASDWSITGTEACATLDPSKLSEGENCIKLVLKNPNPVPCPPCTDVSGTISYEVTNANDNQAQLLINYNFTNLAPGNISFEINGTQAGIIGSYTDVISLEGNASFDYCFDITTINNDCAIRTFSGCYTINVGALGEVKQNVTLICASDCIECPKCDYTASFVKPFADIIYDNGGIPTSMNLPPPGYNPNPTDVALLFTHLSAWAIANGFPPPDNVTRVGTTLTIEGFCVPLIRHIGVWPDVNFVESNCV